MALSCTSRIVTFAFDIGNTALVSSRSFATRPVETFPVVAHIHNERLEAFGAREIEILIAELIEPLPTLRISIAHLGWGGGAGAQAQKALETLGVDGRSPSRRRRPVVGGLLGSSPDERISAAPIDVVRRAGERRIGDEGVGRWPVALGQRHHP